ncbi:hypothetical protein ABK040_009246 [Willaertia magna]
MQEPNIQHHSEVVIEDNNLPETKEEEEGEENEEQITEEIRKIRQEANLNCTITSVIVFFVLGAIWGSAFLFIKIAVDEKHGFSALSVVLMRLVIGGIILLVIFIFELIRSKELRKQVNKHRGMSTILAMMVMGFFNNFIPFVFVAFAEQSINSGIAAILDSSIPLFSMVIAHFALHGEKMSILKVFGLVIGFGGVILVCLQQVITGSTIDVDQLVGYFLVTGASFSYGIASVIAKKYLNDVPGLFASCGQIISAALFSLIAVLFYDLGIDSRHMSYFKHASYLSWISIVYLGVLSTALAYLCFFYLIKHVGSVKQSMVGYLLPVFGVFEGAMFLGEWNGLPFYYPIIEVIGGILICSGIALVSIPSWQELKKGAKKIVSSSKRSKDVEEAIMGDDRYEEENLDNPEEEKGYNNESTSLLSKPQKDYSINK